MDERVREWLELSRNESCNSAPGTIFKNKKGWIEDSNGWESESSFLERTAAITAPGAIKQTKEGKIENSNGWESDSSILERRDAITTPGAREQKKRKDTMRGWPRYSRRHSCFHFFRCSGRKKREGKKIEHLTRWESDSSHFETLNLWRYIYCEPKPETSDCIYLNLWLYIYSNLSHTAYIYTSLNLWLYIYSEPKP